MMPRQWMVSNANSNSNSNSKGTAASVGNGVEWPTPLQGGARPIPQPPARWLGDDRSSIDNNGEDRLFILL